MLSGSDSDEVNSTNPVNATASQFSMRAAGWCSPGFFFLRSDHAFEYISIAKDEGLRH